MKVRIIALILIVIMLAGLLVSCGAEFYCELCESNKTGRIRRFSLVGREFECCSDCYKDLKEAGLADQFD